MNMLRIISVAGMLLVGLVPQASALTAVAEVGEEAWYTQAKATTFGGAELTRFYAPLPVFFEGWKSSPREEIVDWVWDFGDGSPLFRGFNAAHIYENPGSYVATLTVVDKYGQTAQSTVAIEALERTGKTYYIDSSIGNDTNAGTSPEAPWRTATKAFGVMNTKIYQPGDRILFKRGLQYDFAAGQVNPGSVGYGYYFGAYGEGAKPYIKKVGASTAELIRIGRDNLGFWGVMDLEFDCSSAEGGKSSLFVDYNRAVNLFFLRCDIHHHYNAVGLNGDHLTRVITNNFIIGCNIHDNVGDGAVHLYAKASRYAVIDNVFDMSENHATYQSYVNKGIFSGNQFTRWAAGRLALRVSGNGDLAHPSNNIHIINNRIQGWIDPKVGGAHLNGDRYNAVAVELGPNTEDPQYLEHAIIEDNVITDTERFIEIGNLDHGIIRNNTMSTVSTGSGVHRLQVGHPYECRPSKDILICGNTITSNEARSGASGIFFVTKYAGPPYPDRTVHEDITILNNRILIYGGDVRMLVTGNTDPLLLAEITSNGNTLHGVKQLDKLIQFGGTFNSPGALYNLAEWRAMTGNDLATNIVPLQETPVAGVASSPAGSTASPIPVDYEWARAVNDSGLKAVYLWVRKDLEPWAPTGLSSPAGKGTFQYTGMTGSGTYFFATQAEDNLGNLSPAPVDYGHTRTVYQAPGSGDVIPPTTAVARPPAVASSGPIVIPYSGASDAGSGLKLVRLWVRNGTDVWMDSGLSSTLAEGTFEYSGITGDGRYYFAVRAEDNAGNQSMEPIGIGDGVTVYDTIPPNPGTISTSALKKVSPVSLSFSGANDTGGSGLVYVTLWARKDGGAWASTGLTKADYSGSFSFTPSGSGTYDVALVATDRAGLTSPVPTAEGQATFTFDNVAPVAGTVTVPARVDRKPIGISYAGADDALSGLKAVYLWYKNGSAAWTASGLSLAAGSGTFQFDGATNAGTYYFAVQAEDNAGNKTATPTGTGAGATLYEPAFAPGVASAPAIASIAPITVTHTGATDSGGGITRVILWYKQSATGTWADSGLSNAAASGSFAFTPTADATYYFALQAENSTGQLTPVPTGAGDCSTVFDTTAPVAGAPSAPATARTLPISVAYSGAADAGSGLANVALWASKDGGAWGATGLTLTTASGTFRYSPTTGSGSYGFALVATDKTGIASALPSGSGQAATLYDCDAPVAGSLTAPATADQAPVTLTYSGAQDALSGLKSVGLWFKKGVGGTWTRTALTSASASGSFAFDGFSGSDSYYFGLQAEDNAGNVSAAPSGDGAAKITFGAEASPGVASSPQYATKTPITVTYTGAASGAAGLKAVYLWCKKGDAGAWTQTGLSATTGSGSFAFAGVSGDGPYYFATQSEDNAGARTAQPSGSGDTSTLYDTTLPVPGTITAPAVTNQKPIAVSYAGASDGGSGLQKVALWVKKDAGAWSDTGLAGTTASAAFTYTPTQGSGAYKFALVATDKAGLNSPAPLGDGSATVTYDVDAPTTGTVTAAATADRTPIAVSYSGVSDTHSGLKLVRLWVKKDATGTWAPTTLSSTAASGSFAYSGVSGSGTYYFAVQAEDKAGNLSTAPSGDGAARTQYQRALVAGTLTVQAYATTAPVVVSFTGASDSTGAVPTVHLWYKKGSMGAWTDSGLALKSASGTFSFNAFAGDDTYYFAGQAEADTGDRSAAPSGDGTASTVFDTTAPNPGTVQSVRAVKTLPLKVSYYGVSDAGSGVKTVALWMKEGRSGAWVDTGLRSTTAPDGQFSVSNISRDGKYYFFTQVEDKAGNKTAAPTDASVLAR